MEPPKVDEQGLAIRNMFVCMGDASTTQTKEWFSNVKMKGSTRVSSAAKSRPISAASRTDSMGSRPGSARAMSASSLKASMDSGFPRSPSPRRTDSSVSFDLSNLNFDDIPNSERMFHNPPRSRSPLAWKAPIGDDCCVVAVGRSGGRGIYGSPVHVDVVGARKATGGDENDDALLDKISEVSPESGYDGESQQNDSGNETPEPNAPVAEPEIEIKSPNKALQVTTMDQMATFIIAYTFKMAIRNVHPDQTETDINELIDRNLLKSESVTCAELTSESLKNIELQYMEDDTSEAAPQGDLLEVPDDLAMSQSNMSTVMSSGVPDTNDVDSLFDSDREDEDGEECFFSKPKSTFDLSNKKGMDAFKKSLWGTQGEKYLNLWLDIDRGLQIEDPECQLRYV